MSCGPTTGPGCSHPGQLLTSSLGPGKAILRSACLCHEGCMSAMHTYHTCAATTCPVSLCPGSMCSARASPRALSYPLCSAASAMVTWRSSCFPGSSRMGIVRAHAHWPHSPMSLQGQAGTLSGSWALRQSEASAHPFLSPTVATTTHTSPCSRLLLRLVDDFLLVTPHLTQAKAFLR